MDAQNATIEKPNLGRLFARIAKATINLPPLEKKFHPAVGGSAFYYVPADVLIPAAGKALATEGVVIIPDVIEQRLEKVERTWIADLQVAFHICSADGDTFTATIPGNGVSFGTAAKAVKGALTSAHSMLLSNLLHISGESDEEEEGGAPDQGYQQQQRKSQGKPATGQNNTQATGQTNGQNARPAAAANGQNAKPAAVAAEQANGQNGKDAAPAAKPVTDAEVNKLGEELFGEKWAAEFAAKLKAAYNVDAFSALSPENKQAFLVRLKKWLDGYKAAQAEPAPAAK